MHTVFTVGGEYAIIAGEVHTWFGHQRHQPSDKVQRLKYDMGGAVAPRCSPKAPTFGLTRSAPDRYGSLTGAGWKPLVSLCNGTSAPAFHAPASPGVLGNGLHEKRSYALV